MAKTGRPRIEISQEQFEKLCELQCTLGEIAGYFRCSEDTIQRWCKRTYKESFAVVYDKKREVGKISLRRMQWQLAEKNATIAIWLGKQYLGQRDEQRIEIARDKKQDKLDAILGDLAMTSTDTAGGDDNDQAPAIG